MSSRVWWGIFFAWAASIPIWGFFYAAYKFRHCKGRYRFFLAEGFLFLFSLGLLGAALLFPLGFSSDAMQWMLTFTSFALPASGLIGALLLRRFEAKNPEEAQRCYRVEEEMFR